MPNTDQNILPSLNQQQLVINATEKFYFVSEDAQAVREVGRKVFFDYLRTCPQITSNEVEILHSVVNLVAELLHIKELAPSPPDLTTT